MALEYKYEQGQVRLKSSNKSTKVCWYILLLFILSLTGFLGWLYVTGYLTPVNSESAQAISLRGKMNEQQRLLEMQSEKIASFERELGVALREKEIQVTANQELNKKLLLIERKLSDAEEKLLLYGNVLTSKDLKQGLHIQHFSLKPVTVDKDGKKISNKRRHQYHLVLSHIRSDNEQIKGKFLFSISGKKDDKKETLKHTELSPKDQGEAVNTFAMKYYESIEGEIELPKGFAPESVKLKVSPSGGSSINETFQWSSFDKSSS